MKLQPGDTVFDLAQEHAPMVVVDTDLDTVGRLDGALGDAVRTNYANKLLGYDANTPAVKAVYATIDGKPTKPYTFPLTRLVRPEIEHADNVDGTAAQLAQANLIRDMVAAATSTGGGYDATTILALARHVGVPDDLVEYASEMGELDASIGGSDE